MITSAYPIPVTEGFVNANGLNIWYVEAGQGNPLILLHAGTVSNGPLWAGHKWGWGAHLGTFAKHFRVIAPDARGHGRTLNPTGELSYPLLADDLHAFRRWHTAHDFPLLLANRPAPLAAPARASRRQTSGGGVL